MTRTVRGGGASTVASLHPLRNKVNATAASWHVTPVRNVSIQLPSPLVPIRIDHRWSFLIFFKEPNRNLWPNIPSCNTYDNQ
jgi:hypothetical protein